MSEPVHKAGAAGPFLTTVSKTRADRNSAVFTIEGPYSDLEELSDDEILSILEDDDYEGYGIVSVSVEPTGKGMGKAVVRASLFADPSSTENDPIRTTFSVEMVEVTYDLVDHPHFSQAQRDVIKQWLATDESERIDGQVYCYKGKLGATFFINDQTVLQFCAAYMAGIKTFNRYFPIVSKVSTYTNPPGMSMSGSSFTGGEPTFSSGIGSYEDPPLTLNGFGSGHWFKSKDSWQENANRTWTRTEQWTYTPESSTSAHSWIYGGTPGGGAS